MTPGKMHDDEVDIGAPLVRRLLGAQFPGWGDLAIEAFPSVGTVNAIYRLGDELCVRMPRREAWVAHLEKECEWLPRLAPHLPLGVPEPVAAGVPGSGYPFRWAVYRWLDGEPFVSRSVDERRAAADLAAFVADLRRLDPSGAPRSGRRPLRDLDAVTRSAIDSLRGVVDTERVVASWETSVRGPEWDGLPVWRHGDLLPPNLLVEAGRLGAVIDFGSAGIGDPTLDVIAAWAVFGRQGRAAYRDALDVDDATWVRARGFALHQALLIIPYYTDSNPAFAAMATRTVEQVLADSAL